MIKLEFMNQDDEFRNKIVKNYYDELVKTSAKINQLNNWCDSNLDMEKIKMKSYDPSVQSFEMIVRADLETLTRIKEQIVKNKIEMDTNLKDYLINTMYKTKIDRIELIKTLGVTVCPYCNRNYINSNLKKTNCQFDHYINKSKFPILAVSFYNLVPVCPSCNHIKATEDFSYSPYDSSVMTDNIITFSFSLKGVNYLCDPSHLEVIIKNQKILDSNVSILGLKNLYQIHADTVQELIKKKMIYIDEYVKQLSSSFKEGLDSQDEIECLITGAYTNPKEYGKRPLSKMITDISKEIGLINERVER